MIRALDHLVLPCPDLAGTAAALEAAGLLVSGRNRHRWGTENHVVQFAGVFLELIALSADYQPLPPEDDAFPFAGALAGQGAGPASTGMLVWRSTDAEADAAAFTTMGLGAGRRLTFSRTNRRPDGTARTVTFSLAFADAPALAGVEVFTCRQHHPVSFWSPAMQRHPNGATGVRSVRIEASDPAGAAQTLARLAGSVVEPGPDGQGVMLAGNTRLLMVQGREPGCRMVAVDLHGPGAGTLPAIGRIALSIA